MTSKAFDYGRRSIDAFINWDPEDVEVLRRPRIATADGGSYWGEPEPQGIVTVRITPRQTLSAQSLARVTASGSVAVPDYFITALPGSDIERFDLIPRGDVTLEVLWRDVEGPDYRMLFEAVGHGSV